MTYSAIDQITKDNLLICETLIDKIIVQKNVELFVSLQ